jgi:hypothetical protein
MESIEEGKKTKRENWNFLLQELAMQTEAHRLPTTWAVNLDS